MTSGEVKYTIAVCNYNMADTIEESLRSILEQLDDRFEVLVVDGGSTDDSLDILENLQKRYDKLRVLPLPRNKDRRLGKDRDISVRKAKGEYVLPQLDVDDKYENCILDFVEIYHQIEQQVDFDFYLNGSGINMAKKALLLDVPYRNFARGEDLDLWRRLCARGQIISLEHKTVCRQIGYEKSFWDHLKIAGINQPLRDFRGGITLWSFIKWNLLQFSLIGLYRALMAFPTYFIAKARGIYDIPQKFKKKGTLKEEIDKTKMTLTEIEEHYDIEIDRNKLSEAGRKFFYLKD